MTKIGSTPRTWRPAVRTASVALAAALAGCAVGPDFHSPVAPSVADPSRPFTRAPLPAQTASAPTLAGAAQNFSSGADIPAMWWQLFRSEPLEQLIRGAITQSPNLAAAQAALRQAQENYVADAGAKLLPAVSAQVGAQRERASQLTTGVPGGTVFNLYNASVGVSYTIDAFGATRRELEGLRAVVDYQQFQVEATYLALTSNLVTTAIQEASLRAQLQATRDVVDAESKALSLVQTQALGSARWRNHRCSPNRRSSHRRWPRCRRSRRRWRRRISNSPSMPAASPSDLGVPDFGLESLVLPSDLPVSLPSQMVRQRPDIRAAEALLHEASAQVGVATANLYPQITLSGSLGSQALNIDKLFSGGSAVWSLAGGLTQPIFNGGALQARRRAALAAFDQVGAQYQQTVLNAFLNVAQTLRALASDADALAAQADAESLARQSLDIVNRQYKLGATNYLALLDAQRTYQQTKVGLAQAQAARLADTAALFQALGGGWWNRAELADISIDAGSNLTSGKQP